MILIKDKNDDNYEMPSKNFEWEMENFNLKVCKQRDLHCLDQFLELSHPVGHHLDQTLCKPVEAHQW